MKIVVIEDNLSLQASLKKGLEAKGHSVQCFSDGKSGEAFMMVEKSAVDVAVIDYMLPEKDGVSVISSLRAEGIITPILMLTARDSIEDKVTILSSGADYYLSKPFEMAELLVCLEALHRRPASWQKEEMKFGNKFTLNSNNHTFVQDGEVTILTPTEFAILEYLFRNQGRAVSQTELGEHIFDFAKENWSNTIEVHVKNLRKKLHENIITTIRGAGYTLSQ